MRTKYRQWNALSIIVDNSISIVINSLCACSTILYFFFFFKSRYSFFQTLLSNCCICPLLYAAFPLTISKLLKCSKDSLKQKHEKCLGLRNNGVYQVSLFRTRWKIPQKKKAKSYFLCFVQASFILYGYFVNALQANTVRLLYDTAVGVDSDSSQMKKNPYYKHMIL